MRSTMLRAKMLVSALFVGLLFVSVPSRALAIPTEDFITEVQTTIKNVWDEIKDAAANAYLDAAYVFWNNGVQQFVNNLASETATWIASGDEGQKPLLFTSDWGSYLQNAGENAVASVAIEFAKSAGLGNICVSPQVAIDIIIPSLGGLGGPSKPRCTLEQLKKKWDVRDPAFLENFTLSFQTNQNDLGVAVNFLSGLEAAQESATKKALEERRDSAFKRVKDKIADFTKTPAPLVEKQVDKAGNVTSHVLNVYPGRIIGGAVQVFIQTLAGQYLQKLQSGFFSLRDVAGEDARQSALTSLLDSSGTGPSGDESARATFTNIFKPELKSVNDFSVLAEMIQCPAEVAYSGIFNCAIDSGFASALQSSGSRGLLTVREAIDKGMLHGDWAFGFVDPGSGAEPSYLNGYAYSNMKKLRRARIIPVGWELAAQRARQLSRRVNLTEVIEAFDDAASPFYRLVDPEWVLKVPESRCTARTPGQIMALNGPARFPTCADIQDCVVTGADGQCQTWGYCTNEKRSWSFPAAACAAEFATCEQYFDNDGEGDDEDNLWLAKTIEYKGCSAQTAGCTWYALAKNTEGQWRDDDRIYMNRNAKECEAEEAGCRNYIRMVNGSNLLRNSSFEDDAGHNYVLGNGDTTADNSIPDGWNARSVAMALDNDSSKHGANSLRIAMTGAAGVCAPGATYTAPIGTFEVGQQYTLSGQIRTDATTSRKVQLSFQNIPFVIESVTTEWQPFAFQFVMPATSSTYTLLLGANDGTCSDIAATTSVLYDSLQLEKGVKANPFRDYGSTNLIQLKKAPTCSFEDVGCLAYKPANEAGATEISAVATGLNVCPQECAGYNTFEQQATDAEPVKFANFIPDTAKQCSAQQVGCQEYTNLDTVAQGGEGREFYSKIRHCQKPQSQCATYYAWEGSDQSGYQLMTFNLMASNANGSGPAQTTDNSTTCDPTDVNCRELIAADGSRAFRNLTKTVICSEQCVPLRAGPNTVTPEQCAERLGTWDSLSQRCVYQVLPSESRACPAQFAGCREFVGNTGKNVAVVFTDTFEDNDAIGWSTGVISSESTSVGGHSLKLGEAAGTINVTTEIEVPQAIGGKGYELQLSAKSSVPDLLTISVWLGNSKVDASRLGGFITGTRQWNEYRVGPLVLPTDVTTPVKLIFEVRGSSVRTETMSLFVDNFVLRQIKASEYLVKDSWNTPAVCETDPPLAGGSAGRSMLGCREYDVKGPNNVQTKSYVTGFTRLCSKEKVGCEAVLDTFNSKASYRQIFQEGDVAERVVPEDQVRFIVNRPEYQCDTNVVGCMELGKPSFDVDGNLKGYESVYRINNPDTYTQTLCKAEGLFCKEFTTSSNSIVYAKHPGEQQCEYREVANSFPPRFAWFKVGSNEENPAECLDADKNLYVQRCPAEEISCTEYEEPITKESFYYRKNTLKDRRSECNGIVDWKRGCVVFDDKSIREKTFKSGDVVDVVGTPDPCQTNDVGCNANILLKVNLDRVCSQWLTGLSTSRFWDRNLQQFRTTSYGLGRCIKADPLNPNICLKWDNAPDKPLLNIDTYRARDVSWAGQDYSGYSIPNIFPAETLRQRSVGIDEDGNPTGFRLTRLDNPGSTCRSTTDCPVGQVCRLSMNSTTASFEGQCYVELGLDGSGTSVGTQCRGYPEDDSPFPSKLAIFAPASDEKNPGQIVSKDPLFKNANLGQDGEDVECSYHKVFFGASAGGQSRYYSVNTLPPAKIKVNGEDQPYNRKDTFIGWTGYCLEYDLSRIVNGSQNEFACLTWYPVDVINGALDFNNSALKSGYVVPNDRESYCVESTFAEYRTQIVWCGANCPSGYKLSRRAESSTCSNGRRKRICDPVNGNGWYAYDGGLLGNEGVYGIQQMCTKVARISTPDGRNRAWTTRILGKALPGAKIYFVDDLGWGPQQQNEPYGAARTLVPRLEDLPEALLVRDPNTYVNDCKDCKVNEGEPFGVCEDEQPEKKGRKCPITPNAGSPYAMMYEADPARINNENILLRRDNKLPEDEAQPYPKSEDYKAGFARLQQLFARSYGIYQWQSVNNICVGVCQGGLSDGEACESDTACGDPDTTVTYTCTPGTCVGGFKDSQSCAATADCQAPRTGTIHQCVAVTGPDADPNNPSFVCESGPFQGRDCSSIADCDENKADGVCSLESRCQAKDSTGATIISVNSGQLCNSDSECNARGTCRVQRCSTESAGSGSGLCSGKKAGDVCGTTVEGISQYVRLPANNPAVGWDIVVSNPAGTQPPYVRPTVVDSLSPSGFTEGAVTGFSVNGSTSGNVAFVGGRAPVTVSFYAYNENGEQMPLRVVMVDWGDGSDPAESRGSFPNRKHVCRKFCSNAIGVACTFDQECQSEAAPDAQCEPFNFGDSDDACLGDSGTSNGYFTFSYTYTCEGAADCTFTPAVMVRDNWGATTRVTFPGTVVVTPAPVEVP